MNDDRKWNWVDTLLSYADIIRCEDCGSWSLAENVYSYTNFGGCKDIDPPEPRYCCEKCRNTMKDEYYWRPPMKIRSW